MIHEDSTLAEIHRLRRSLATLLRDAPEGGMAPPPDLAALLEECFR
jgi:hypothetical protein